MTAHAGPMPVTRIRSGRSGGPARSARVTVEIDLAGGHAPGVASALCAEISDLLAEHARSGDTSVSASVSLGFGDAPMRTAMPSAPLFSGGETGSPTWAPATDAADPAARGTDAAGGAAPGTDAAGGAAPGTDPAGGATRDGAAGAARAAAGAVPGLRIVAGRREAVQDGVELPLTRREFDLLSYLARNPRQVFSRSQLIDAVWGARYRDSERTIDVHVRRIRVKLSPTGPQIVTVRGVGYRLDHPDRVAVVPGVE
ncbi:winged helix-turn-helix domain-containing protein [Cryptosporangium sp. NPDC048952]|uniref:winged helix-turn-helix domain-containing protein n=1 Tax=Cryptosporangium sp. NPDC048952 TaxID=3363961 RepID=UPI00371D02E6